MVAPPRSLLRENMAEAAKKIDFAPFIPN